MMRRSSRSCRLRGPVERAATGEPKRDDVVGRIEGAAARDVSSDVAVSAKTAVEADASCSVHVAMPASPCDAQIWFPASTTRLKPSCDSRFGWVYSFASLGAAGER